MGTLEEVMNMKAQGIGDQDISYALQQKGVSPKEISNALNQAQIKMAIINEPQEELPQEAYPEDYGQNQYTQENYPRQEMYPMDQSYSQETYSSPQTDSDSTLEIVEQVFEEKIKSVKKEIEKFNEFRSLTQTKIDAISERLKRIESMIDKLQISILEKIGSYGQDIGSIKKEMEMIENSFSKAINPILEQNETLTKTQRVAPQKEPSLEDITTKTRKS